MTKINQKNKRISAIFLWLLGLTFPLVINVAVSSDSLNIQIIDHGNNPLKAEKWAKEHYLAWKKKLSQEEENSFHKLLQPLKDQEKDNLDNVNYQLKIYGGELEARPDDIIEENEKLQNHVNRLHHAINRKEGKLTKPLIVYKKENADNIFHIDNQHFKNPDGTLNQDEVQKLKIDFLFGQHSEFGIYDLFEDMKSSPLIKWKIELPAGTLTGFMDNHRIVIDKDSAFQVTSIKIIAQKGTQKIRIEAKLIPKKTAINEISKITNKIHNDFNAQFQIPKDQTFLEFKLTGISSHFIAKKLKRLIATFTTTINPDILSKTLQFMSKSGGKIVFTDRPLYTFPNVYPADERSLAAVIDMMGTYGYFSFSTLSMFIDVTNNLQKNLELDSSTLFHEFGHAVDHYGGQILKTGLWYVSETKEFAAIFAKEGQKLTEYGSSSAHEFFAEAFWLMHSPHDRQRVKADAPLVYDFILQVLESVADHKPVSAKQNMGSTLYPYKKFIPFYYFSD